MFYVNLLSPVRREWTEGYCCTRGPWESLLERQSVSGRGEQAGVL